jgi:hypothetical protein
MATAVLTGGTRTAAVTDGGHGWSSGVPRPGKPGPASSRNGPSNGRPWTRTAGLAEPKPSRERSLLPGALLSDRDVGIPFPCGIPPSADLRTLIEATPATASPSRPDLAAVGADLVVRAMTLLGPSRSRSGHGWPGSRPRPALSWRRRADPGRRGSTRPRSTASAASRCSSSTASTSDRSSLPLAGSNQPVASMTPSRVMFSVTSRSLIPASPVRVLTGSRFEAPAVRRHFGSEGKASPPREPLTPAERGDARR